MGQCSVIRGFSTLGNNLLGWIWSPIATLSAAAPFPHIPENTSMDRIDKTTALCIWHIEGSTWAPKVSLQNDLNKPVVTRRTLGIRKKRVCDIGSLGKHTWHTTNNTNDVLSLGASSFPRTMNTRRKKTDSALWPRNLDFATTPFTTHQEATKTRGGLHWLPFKHFPFHH